MPDLMIGAQPRRHVRRIALTRTVLGALTVAAFVWFSISSPYFLTAANLVNLLNDVALTGIVAIPATFLMMSGQVDLSVGAAAAFTGIVLALAAPDIGATAAIVLAAGAGLVIGFVNGGLVTIGRVNSVATTFATMTLLRGLAYMLPSGLAIVIPGFAALGNTRPIWGIALPTLIFAAIALIAALLSTSTAGRRVRAIGRLPSDIRLDGRPERRWIMALYVASGLAAALVGMIRTSQLGAGLPTAAIGLEVTAVTAVLLGGGHLAGGRGSVGGTLLALLMIYIVENGLSLANVTAYADQVFVAALLVVALIIDGPVRWKAPSRASGRPFRFTDHPSGDRDDGGSAVATRTPPD